MYSLEKKSYYFVIEEGIELIGNRKQAGTLRKYIKKYLEKRRFSKPILITGKSGSGKTHLAFYGISYAKKELTSVQYGYFDFRSRGNMPGVELLKEFFLHIFNLQNVVHAKDLFKKIDSYLKKHVNLSRAEKEIIIRYLLREKQSLSINLNVEEDVAAAITLLFRTISSTYPLILVFDGIEYADEKIKNIVKDLVTVKNARYLSIVINGVEQFHIPGAHIIKTSELVFEDIEKLIVKITKKHPHSNLAEYILQKSQGNLRTAFEIVKLLYEKDALIEQSGYLVMKAGVYELPDSINHIMLARYDTLPREAKDFLKYAAVYGIRFVPDLISLAFFNGKNLKNTVLYLTEKGIISGTTENVYVFRDHLFKDAIYSTLPLKFLKKAHREMADIMEKHPEWQEDFYSLFYHNYMAGRKRKTLLYGEMALKRLSNLALYEDILDVADTLIKLTSSRDKKYYEFILKKADALYNLGRVSEALKIYDRVINLARDSTTRAWALYKSAYILDSTGKKEEGEKRLKEAIKIGKRHKRLIAQCYLNLGILYQKRDTDKAYSYLEKAYRYAEGQDETIVAKVLLNMGIVSEFSGKVERAKDYYEEALKRYQMIGYTLGMVRVYQLLATNMVKQKDIENAVKFYRKAYNTGKKYNIKFALPSILLNMGTFYAELGKFRKSVIYFKKAERLLEESMQKTSRGVLYNNLSDIYNKKGKNKKALFYALSAVKIADSISVPYYMVHFRITLLSILWKFKNYDEMEKVLSEISNILEKHSRFSFFRPYADIYRAKLDYAKGNKDSALERLISLRESVKDPDLALRIDFEIWKMNRDTNLKDKLKKELQYLYQKYRLYDYKAMLEELSSD